jgi:alkylation response protein AidB-like acyl-CoA dehydrogenase
MSDVRQHNKPRGGSFIDLNDRVSEIFSPEDFSEEQILIRETAKRFVEEEVLPETGRIERQEWDVTVQLLKRCAALGLVGLEIPESFGGSGLDRVSAMIVAEQMARLGSFSVSWGGQSGIGSLPILYFGSNALRNKYLQLLCSAEKLSAYALSEANSGSDALAARTTAVRRSDGNHWILNGEKMWVTNAAFADIFITFAKVDGQLFSCFAVEKVFTGVSTGAEEHKMGLKGSSTRPLVLSDVHVPAENLIGQVGRGHEVAFNILNIGRAKLGASATGASKLALDDSIRYSTQRIAFGKSISSFGAIQHKLAEMAIRIWVLEGMVYRTADSMDQVMEGVDLDDGPGVLRALREFAVECSIVKVFGSETLDYVVDETVQIHGGYGFSTEYPAERYYRDSRVHRIFEGTNEINRLMISGTLIRQMSAAMEGPHNSDGLSEMGETLPIVKTVFAALVRAAIQKYGESFCKNGDEQELQMLLADIAIEIYAMDTAFIRSRKVMAAGGSEFCRDITMTYQSDAHFRIAHATGQILARLGLPENVAATILKPLLNWRPADTVAARRRVAAHLLQSARYSI